MKAVDGRIWLVLPAALVLAVAFLGPVGWLLARAFTFPEPGLQNFAVLWERPVYLKVIGNTLLISAVVTPVVVLLAFPVAHLMAHGSARLRRWLIFLVLVPFWTSLLVRAFATAILLQRHGVVNSLLVTLGLVDEPLPLLYNFGGLLAGCVQVLLPFVIFPLYSSMVRIDPAYMKAAATLGATPVRARRAEEILTGKRLSLDSAVEAGKAASQECDPISDLRGSADYKRAIVGTLVRRAAVKAYERAMRN